MGLRLPAHAAHDRAARISQLHSELRTLVAAFLRSGDGEYLVREFRLMYPDAHITEMKMLDLVLWQKRG